MCMCPSFQSVQVPVYTTQEYQMHLHDDKWSKNATDHLFDMCSRFDLRWVVIHDRFDTSAYGVSIPSLWGSIMGRSLT